MSTMTPVLFHCCNQTFAALVPEIGAEIKCPVCGLKRQSTAADVCKPDDAGQWWAAYLRHRYWRMTHRGDTTGNSQRDKHTPRHGRDPPRSAHDGKS